VNDVKLSDAQLLQLQDAMEKAIDRKMAAELRKAAKEAAKEAATEIKRDLAREILGTVMPVLQQIQRPVAKLFDDRETKRALIALGGQTVISLVGVWSVYSGDRAVVWGASIAHNVRAVKSAYSSCQSDLWGCATLKYAPKFEWGVSPKDNVTAMLDLVAWAEGTDSNYNMIYTGEKFTDYSKHPDRVMCSAGLCSAAAGRYQIMPQTWATVSAKLKLPDFSPQSQDKAAIQLMKDAGCYGAAVRGDVADFADRCWTVWASFQGRDGEKLDNRQRSHQIDKLQAKYQEFRGVGKLVKPLSTMTLTSPFGSARPHPVSGVVRPHQGADYACSVGDTIDSPIDGTLKQGPSDPSGFGSNWGTVSGGGYEITLGHTSALLVRSGDRVRAGQPIARCGDEGTGTGPHLHLEIRKDGELIDPAKIYK
jgi:muramidase (phage lysozyme)